MFVRANKILLTLFCIHWICVSSFTPTQKLIGTERYSSQNIIRSNNGNNSIKTSLYSTYNRKRKVNGKYQYSSKHNGRYDSNDRTELHRTKLLLAQVRGNLQESEMRATAAEHRVARLTQEMKLLKISMDGETVAANTNVTSSSSSSSSSSNTSTISSSDDKSEESNLQAKVFDLKQSLKELNNKMQKEIQKLQSVHSKDLAEWESRERDLYHNLNKAKKEHKKALHEVSALKTTIESLDKDIRRITLQATIEMDELKASHDTAISNMQMDSLEVQNNLEKVNSKLEAKLMDEKLHSDQLRLDISKIQRDAAEEAHTLQGKHTVELNAIKRDLAFQKKELEDRNDQIEELHKERSRIRTLAKLQFGLVKSRVKNRYKKIFRRGGQK